MDTRKGKVSFLTANFLMQNTNSRFAVDSQSRKARHVTRIEEDDDVVELKRCSKVSGKKFACELLPLVNRSLTTCLFLLLSYSLDSRSCTFK